MTRNELLAAKEHTRWRNTQTGVEYKLILVMAGEHVFQQVKPVNPWAIHIKTKNIRAGAIDAEIKDWEEVKSETDMV